MADFQIAYAITLGHEGLYSNDPNDSGGETYKGISRKHNPTWPGWQHIDNFINVFKLIQGNELNSGLSKILNLQTEVTKFYFDNYWVKAKLNNLPQPIANEIFDTGVNQGLNRAVSYFQKSLNILNNDQNDYPDIKEDGILGDRTLDIFHAYMKVPKSGRSELRNISTIVKLLNGLQLNSYINFVVAKPSQERFMYGWINRT